MWKQQSLFRRSLDRLLFFNCMEKRKGGPYQMTLNSCLIFSPLELNCPPASAPRVGKTVDIAHLPNLAVFGSSISMCSASTEVYSFLEANSRVPFTAHENNTIQNGHFRKNLSSRGRGRSGVWERKG